MTTETREEIGWAILELMGHRRLAGYVQEQEIAGAKLLRIDVYDAEPPEDGEELPIATQFYSAAAIYCITPSTEGTARAVGATGRPEPVQRWELPAPAETSTGGEDWCGG